MMEKLTIARHVEFSHHLWLTSPITAAPLPCLHIHITSPAFHLQVAVLEK